MSDDTVFDGPSYSCGLCKRLLRLVHHNQGYASEVSEDNHEKITALRHHCPVLRQQQTYRMFTDMKDFDDRIGEAPIKRYGSLERR